MPKAKVRKDDDQKIYEKIYGEQHDNPGFNAYAALAAYQILQKRS